jgi:hypothetical protein
MDFSGQYLTYNEYKALGGRLDQTPFNLLEYDVRKEVDKQTLGRLINLEKQREEVKMCVWELINLQQSINNGVDISGNVVNYKSKEITKVKSDTIRRYLLNCSLEDGTPYLYRGV